MNKPYYTVYDIETTGLSAACQCEIIEFAGIQYDEHLNELQRLHIYIKPYNKLPKKIVELTGITNEQLTGCENRFQALPKIRKFIGDTISVCHNASFDVGFISTMCVLQGLPPLTQYICTMKTYKNLTGEKNAKLFMACEKFGISLENAHTAICDAEATAHLFKKLMQMNQEEKSGIYFKSAEEKDVYISCMANIASQNPNKKNRDAVTSFSSGNKELVISTVIKEFNLGKDPNYIASKYSFCHDDIASLFALWLNPKRLPKFIYLEDYSLNKQISTMINYASSIDNLYELHKICYKDLTINKGLYNYFWIKLRHQDLQEYQKALNILFSFEYDLIDIINEFPHIHPSDVVLTFCDFAQKNKDSKRTYIARNISSRTELTNALDLDEVRFPDSMIMETPELVKLAVTCELYNRDFFNI